MENSKNSAKEYYVIDVAHIFKSIWYRIWVVILAGFIAAGIGFSLAAFAITPTYSSSIMLYVNNSSISLNDVGFSLSSSDLTAAQSLVKTYNVLLKNRTTLERVIDETGITYAWDDLYDMIEASSVDETEVMKITVTTVDPYLSEKIANGIATVLPQRVAEVVEGTSMEVVDSAIPNLQKVAPSITKYTAVGFILGVLLSVLCLAVSALLDNTIQDEDYIIQNYKYPILAKIPDLLDGGTKRYGYRYGYNYYRRDKKQNSEEATDNGN